MDTNQLTSRILNTQFFTESNLKHAVKILMNEGLVAVPTDTIYGICCVAQSDSAVKRLYSLKGRDFNKPVAICVGDVSDFYRWCHVTVPSSLLHDLLPGPVTLVFSRKEDLNPSLNPSTSLIGIRIPDYTLLTDLVRSLDQPLALTSANKSGQTSTLKVDEFSSLWSELDLILDGGTLHESDSERCGSTVIDLSMADVAGTYRVIRHGSSFVSTVNILEAKYGLVLDSQQCSDTDS